MSDLFQDLQWRGLIHQTTDEEAVRKLLETSQSVYVGFDPTADSLHVGSLLGLMTLRRLQRAGHRPIVLIGGATGMIGDPSGKSEERNLLSAQQLQANIQGMQQQMRRFLDFDAGDQSAELVNNHDWMQSFGFLDFLRDVGKNFPVNVMLAKDSVKSRIGRDGGGISYTEFSYMLLQAYDFVHLSRTHDCRLQLGGSDQWGNITAGIDLARRMDSATLHGLTWPLLTKSDGSKFGKTEKGNIWLSEQLTSPFEFYQYWINVSDDEAGHCLRFLTELPREEIESLDQARIDAPQQRQSQRRLAESLTELVHGEAGLQAAQRATETLFGAEIEAWDDEALLQVFADVPSHPLPPEQLQTGWPLIDALVASGLVKSKGEGRRAIQQGGAYVNNRRVSDVAYQLSSDDLASQTVIVLRRGRKNYGLIRVQ